MSLEVVRIMTALDAKIDALGGLEGSATIELSGKILSVIPDSARYLSNNANGVGIATGYQPMTTAEAAKLTALPSAASLSASLDDLQTGIDDLDTKVDGIQTDLQGQIDDLDTNKLDASAANHSFVTGLAVGGSGDSRTLVYNTRNIATGATAAPTTAIPVATATDAGLMSTTQFDELATALTDISGLDADKADKTDLDQVVATGATVTGSGDNNYIETAKVNLMSGATSSSQDMIHLATTSRAGFMSMADYAALQQAKQDIEALKGATTKWLVDLSEAADQNNPTGQELQDAYEAASGETGAAPDGTQLFDQETGLTFQWFESSNEWVLMSIPQVGLFTNENPGLIVGSDDIVESDVHVNEGKIYAENDGTGSVIGWGALRGRVATAESDIDTLQGDYTSLASRVSNVETDLATAQTDISALEEQVFDKNTPLLGAVSDYAALMAKLMTEGYFV